MGDTPVSPIRELRIVLRVTHLCRPLGAPNGECLMGDAIKLRHPLDSGGHYFFETSISQKFEQNGKVPGQIGYTIGGAM